MTQPTKRQAHLIASHAAQAVDNLDKALNVAERTEDSRLIANVRSKRDAAKQLEREMAAFYRELTEGE